SGSASSGSASSGSTGTDPQAASDTTPPATRQNSDQQSASTSTAGSGDVSADRQASSATAQKDGGDVPPAQSEQDQTGNQIAMSQQDVEAQQEGEATMAAKTDPDC